MLNVLYEKKSEKLFQRTIGKKNIQKISKKIYSEPLKDFLSLNEVQEIKIYEEELRIGFRVVHGGKEFRRPTKVTKSVLKKLKKLDSLAPLHNPVARVLVEKSIKLFPKAKSQLFFDTSFHHTLPEDSWRYALPLSLADKHGLRRYGFHGILCSSIVHQLKERRILKKRLIICHLGSGCSVTAVKNGESMGTSMGMTPLEGLVMSTRAGDLDPGLILFLQDSLKMSPKKISELLHHESGLKGLAGMSDMRELLKKSQKDSSAKLALEIFCRRAAEYIAKSSVSLAGLDQIIFSGGIGENSPLIRKKICNQLLHLGVKIHPSKNKTAKSLQALHKRFSRVKIYWIHADEATEINRQLLTV